MAVPVIMPRQGQSVESCVITKWNKKPGDSVKIGDILFAYETDKAAFEEEAKADGTLLGVFFQEGDDVPCLTNLCVIGNPGESFAEFDPNGGSTSPAPTETQAAPAAATSISTATTAEAAAPGAPGATGTVGAPVTGEMKISPRAQAMAEARHADLSKVTATGPDGRVIARDVQALLDKGFTVSPAAAAAYPGGLEGTGLGGRVTLADLSRPTTNNVSAVEAAPVGVPSDDSYEEPLTNMRKTIAKAMVASLSTMAQLTHTASFDATEIQAARQLFKGSMGAALGMDRISLNDIILFAVSRTLMMPEHRALNANLLDGAKMKYFRTANLGMAVDTERGLMVPVLFGADRMSLLQVSQTAKQLAKDCQGGTINPDYLRGGSFTISNLGALGIESFTPVINPPQTGILGVNTVTTRVREGANGQIETYPCMTLSLTYDHRALDGAPASRFLRDLCLNLENFTLLLAKG